MRRYAEGLDELDTFEARFGPPRLSVSEAGAVLVIPAVSIGVSNHPLNPSAELRYLDRALLRFEEVLESKRQVSDYRPDGSLMEPSCPVVDIEAARALPTDAPVYRLQGVEGLDPGRYVLDWRIVASRFSLLVPDDAELAAAPVMLNAALARFLLGDDHGSGPPGAAS